MDVLVLSEADVRGLLTPSAALSSVRAAFRALAEGRAVQPPSFDLDLPKVRGGMHVKGAYIEGLQHFAVKSAAGFDGVNSGMSLVFDAKTGALAALVLDNGWLTEIRTGAAGALAAELLAIEKPQAIGIVGAGVQARYQLRALLEVRSAPKILAWSRSAERTRAYADEMSKSCGVAVEVAAAIEDLVRRCQIIVTTTPSRAPIVKADWVQPGTHITAMGSDMTGKQELDVEILRRANRVVADLKENCERSGEIGCAIRAGAITGDAVVNLGDVVTGRAHGRRSASDITVADQCGLGICDTAVADAAVTAAIARGIGRRLRV